MKKLKINDVHEICRLLKKTDMLYREIADKFNTTISNISSINNLRNCTEIAKQYSDDGLYIRDDTLSRSQSPASARPDLPSRKKRIEQSAHLICNMLKNTEVPMVEIADMFGLAIHDVTSINKIVSMPEVGKMYASGKPTIRKTGLSYDDVHEICRLLRDTKVSYQKIADRFDTHKPDIVYINQLKIFHQIGELYSKNGEYIRPKGLTDEKVHNICLYLKEKKRNSARDIAELFNVRHQVVNSINELKIHPEIGREYADGKKSIRPKNLTRYKITKICKLLTGTTLGYTDIAKVCGTDYSTVYNIDHMRSHKHIGEKFSKDGMTIR